MSANTVYVGPRNIPASGVLTAGGGFTLPQQAYIPAASTFHLATGSVADPLHLSGMLPTPSFRRASSTSTVMPNKAVYGLVPSPTR